MSGGLAQSTMRDRTPFSALFLASTRDIDIGHPSGMGRAVHKEKDVRTQ